MVYRKVTSRKGKLIRYFLVVFILIALIPDLVVGSNRDNARVTVNWIPDPPGKFWTIRVSYEASDRAGGCYNLPGIPMGKDVEVKLIPVSRDEFDVFPITKAALGPEYIQECDWTVALKNNAKNPKLVLQWCVISEDEWSGMGHKPNGETPLEIPKGVFY